MVVTAINTVTLSADLEPKTPKSPNTNDLYIWVQSF